MADDHSRPETRYFKKDASRAKKKTFFTRKECIKKKTMELSVLCDVKACAVIVGPDGKIETWPENRSEVREVMDLYKNDYLNNKKRKREHDDHGCEKKRVLGGDDREGVLKDFLEKVEAKIDQVKKQILLVKSKDQETESGRSFVKYATSEEPDKFDYSFSYPASELGNPLCGCGIPPNVWRSQNLCSHSYYVGMPGFGNQLPGDIVSSTPGYIGVFPSNFDGIHLGPVVSSTPMSQLASFQSSQPAFSLLQQQLQMPQPSSYIDCATAPSRTESPIFQETSFSIQAMETPCFLDYQLDEINGFELASQIPLSFDQCSAGFGLRGTENYSNYIDCAATPSWFEAESTFMAGVEESQQNYIDDQTMETPCFFGYQLDEIHGFEDERQFMPLSFDQYCGTGFELSAAENIDPFSTRVEYWTENRFCTSTSGLDTGFELPPAQPRPPSSCFSYTPGEEDELAFLLRQPQQTAPTLNSFNPNCGLTDTLGFPSNVTAQ